MLEWVVPVLIIVVIWIRLKKRGYFWKDKKGKELSFKEFMKRWKNGVEGITPLQQTRTTLWSFLPLVAGILWGITVTFLGKTYWMTLILCGSLPITLIQVLSNYQKYTKQKAVEETLKELNKKTKR